MSVPLLRAPSFRALEAPSGVAAGFSPPSSPSSVASLSDGDGPRYTYAGRATFSVAQAVQRMLHTPAKDAPPCVSVPEALCAAVVEARLPPHRHSTARLLQLLRCTEPPTPRSALAACAMLRVVLGDVAPESVQEALDALLRTVHNICVLQCCPQRAAQLQPILDFVRATGLKFRALQA